MKIQDFILPSENCTHMGRLFSHPEEALLFDIETTGFSPRNAFVYLIGCAFYSGSDWRVRQFLAEDARQERQVLEAFLSFSASFPLWVHFNGHTFDVPFLMSRARTLGLSFAQPSGQLDLYKSISPYKNLLQLPGCRQKQLEEYLGIRREDPYHGGELIGLYLSYTKNHSEELLAPVLLHNREDLSGLVSVCRLLAVPSLFEKDGFSVPEASYDAGALSLSLQLNLPLPAAIACQTGPFCLAARQDRAVLRVSAHTGELKYFYPDYKNYAYLPLEDQAIHKSVAIYVDKTQRMPATAATCYTRRQGVFVPAPGPFSCQAPLFKENHEARQTFLLMDDAFLSNASLLTEYVKEALLVLSGRNAAGSQQKRTPK